MDPATLAFLITGVASLLGFAAAGAARDVAHIASKKDGPLPSEQAAAKRRERRERLGKTLNPDEKAPGYLRRLLTNAHEERRVKAAGARRADRDWLDQNRDQLDTDGYEKEKAKRERRAANKASRTRMLDAFMNAPKGQRFKAAFAARKADRDKTDKEVVDEQDQADQRPDAQVLPFRPKPASREELIDRWRKAIADGRDADVMTADEWNNLPSEVRDQLISEAEAVNYRTVEFKPDGTVRQLTQNTDPAPASTEPAEAGNTTNQPDGDQNPDGQNTNAVPTATNTQEDNPMAVIPEIQNISGAITMAEQLAEHAANVQAKTDASRGQWETAIAEQDEIKAAAENGASTFREQDLHKAAAVLDRLAEAVAAMQNTYRTHLEADAQLVADADNFNAICTDLGKTLQAQQPVAETINSAEEVAKDTKYYQYS